MDGEAGEPVAAPARAGEGALTAARTTRAALPRWFGASFLGDGAAALVATLAVANAGNLAFHVAVTRLLVPAAYGPLVALLGGLLVLVVPLTAVQAVVTSAVAARRVEGAQPIRSIRHAVARCGLAGVAAAAVVAAVAPVVEGFLHLATPVPVVLVGLFMVPALVGLVPRGLLLGERRFRTVAVAVLCGVAARLVAGVALTGAGMGLEGALTATVAGETVTCLVLLASVRSVLAPPGPAESGAESLPLRLSGIVGPIAAFVGFWALAGIDTMLAQHYFGRAQSGTYGAAAAAARAALFLPGAVALVAFPTFAASGGHGPAARRALRQALATVGLLGAAAALGLAAFPRLAVEVLFGRAYVGPPAVVVLLAFSCAMVGLVGVLLHFHLAARSRATLLPWVGVVGVVAAVHAWHGSLQQVAAAMALSTTAVFLAMLVAARAPAPAIAVDQTTAPDLACPLDLSLVVPYYNPGPALRANLSALVTALHESGVSFEIIPVADGCTDGSDSIVRDWPDTAVQGVALPSHQGKGAALRVGLSVGRGRYLGFIDGDGDLDPRLLLPFVDLVRHQQPHIVLGSKRHPQSEVAYPPLRRLYSWAYQQLIRVLFRLEVRDTQTGLKLIRRDVLADVLPRMVERRFVFDLELFVVARQLGYRDFLEAPVRIRHRFHSTISLIAVLRMLRDTLGVFYRLHVGRAYGRPQLEGFRPRVPEGVGSPVG